MSCSLLPNGVTLGCRKKPELSVSSHPGSHSPQGSVAGSWGGCPFPLQRSSVGIRWVSPQQSILGESGWGRKGSKGTAQPLTSLISSFPSQIECLPACLEISSESTTNVLCPFSRWYSFHQLVLGHYSSFFAALSPHSWPLPSYTAYMHRSCVFS